MSYLSQSLRLHFAGQFQATVSTVNNDVMHFNNQTFVPDFQERLVPGGPMNGWWNPQGDGVWRLMGCKVTSAFLANGKEAAKSDPVLKMQVADSDDSAPAKIVDLDPQQQMVSTIFGLTVRIADGKGRTLMKGAFQPAAFTELWNKVWSATAGGDAAYGAMWQSVIRVSEWAADAPKSPFLKALKAAADASGGLLSIKFNVDLYSMNYPQPNDTGDNNFCRGRVTGTIGPAAADEPACFVPGRQLYPQMIGGAVMNFCAAVLDEKKKLLRLDLGNALPVTGEGVPVPLGDLLVCAPAPNGRLALLATLPQSVYSDVKWYLRTAGVVELPLTKENVTLAADGPLQIMIGSSKSAPAVVQEMDGLYVRADQFVLRLSPGEQKTVTLYATQLGKPYAGKEIVFFANPTQLQGPPAPPNMPPGTLVKKGDPAAQFFPPGTPYVAAPDDGVSYPSSVTTDKNGRAQITVNGGDTKKFRQYIDGQLYGIGYGLADQGFESGSGPQQSLTNLDGILANSWNFISVLVFDDFKPGNPVTWDDLKYIFQQYANLYPVMKRFIDLGDEQQVKSYARMLIHAFALPDEDPNAMPVTRDLSPAKRAAILQWLKSLPEQPRDASPRLGGKPAAKVLKAAKPAKASKAAQLHPLALTGGKAAAMARRQCMLKA